MLNEAILEKEIKVLWHFTRLSNLESIFKIGMIPRSQFAKYGISPTVNDECRIDDCLEANCLSIQFPNYKMFYSYRKQNESVEWTVLGIDVSVLWQKDCAFCVTNAASNAVRFTPVAERKGVAAFKRLFEEVDGKQNRASVRLPKSYPTDPQAEVLVFDKIEPEFMLGAAFDNQRLVDVYKNLYPNYQIVRNSDLFGPRRDYENWK